MSQLSFQHYKVPDALDNVQALADEMVLSSPERYNMLLLDTYSEAYIERVDIPEIADILKSFTMQNAKVIMSGKNLLNDFEEGDTLKEQYMKTKYKVIQKP